MYMCIYRDCLDPQQKCTSVISVILLVYVYSTCQKNGAYSVPCRAVATAYAHGRMAMNWRSLTFRFRPRRHGQPAQRRRSAYFRFHSCARVRVQLIIKLSGVKIVVLSRSFCTRRLEPSTIYSSPGAAYRLLIAWSLLLCTHRLELLTVYSSPGAFYCVLIAWSHLPSTHRLEPSTVYSSPGAIYRLLIAWSLLLCTHRLEPSTVYSSPGAFYCVLFPGAVYYLLIAWSFLLCTHRLEPSTIYSLPGAVYYLLIAWSCTTILSLELSTTCTFWISTPN